MFKFPIFDTCASSIIITSRRTGTVYAVNVEKRRSAGPAWARGVLHELPGRGRARVLLPDSGALLLVHWTDLRQIHQKFTTLSALVSVSYRLRT